LELEYELKSQAKPLKESNKRLDINSATNSEDMEVDTIEDKKIEKDTWDTDIIMKHAESMSRLKKKMFEKAKENIDEAQRKDKKYYDLKHSHPKVCINHTSSHFEFCGRFKN